MPCPLNSRAPNHDDSECMCIGDTATANGMTTTTIEACRGMSIHKCTSSSLSFMRTVLSLPPPSLPPSL